MSKWLGVRQKTAWFLLHRLREALKKENNILLSGIVEVDEAYVGPNIHRDLRLQRKKRLHTINQEKLHGLPKDKRRRKFGPSKRGRKKGSTAEVLEFQKSVQEMKGKKVIEVYRERFYKNGYENRFSLNHGEVITGSTITQSFLINKENRKTLRAEFQKLPIGTWMVLVEMDEATFQKIEEQNLRGFSVEGTFNIQGQGKTYTVYEKFRIMNKLSDILPFEVHVFGGSTSGAGRNEHGEAHFQIKEKNTHKDLGKIFMPTLETWNNTDLKGKINFMTLYAGVDIKTKEKKIFINWLDRNNQENLIRCHAQWNESNKHNNRTILI